MQQGAYKCTCCSTLRKRRRHFPLFELMNTCMRPRMQKLCCILRCISWHAFGTRTVRSDESKHGVRLRLRDPYKKRQDWFHDENMEVSIDRDRYRRVLIHTKAKSTTYVYTAYAIAILHFYIGILSTRPTRPRYLCIMRAVLLGLAKSWAGCKIVLLAMVYFNTCTSASTRIRIHTYIGIPRL